MPFTMEEKLERLRQRRDPDGIESEHGSRRAPIVVEGPEDMAAAALRVRHPTEGAARAGNYRMAHVLVGGLEMSIETPMGGIRAGVDPHGTPWTVRMPADYGYIKNSEGADGDHIDVYLGTHAHVAETLPVWVVDQKHVETGVFDEHKCMIGFPDAVAARRAYIAGFSDGRGKDRIGAVTRMTWDDFIKWLTRGDAKKAVTYAEAAKSASEILQYSVSLQSCSCGGACPSCASSGVHMSKTPAEGTTAPATMGFINRLVSKAMGSMTAAERTEFIADAAASSATALAKASDELHRPAEQGRMMVVEDLWDGAPDTLLDTVRTGGPGSTTPAGDVGVGPRQAASGEGALEMERRYSNHAMQRGVVEATNKLGRELAKALRTLAAFTEFGKAVDSRLSLLESTALAAPAVEVVKSDFNAEIAKSVAAAMPGMLRQSALVVSRAIAKSEASDEEEAEDSEAEEAEIMAKSDIEIEDEVEGDDDKNEDKACAKEAAKARLVAKSLIRLSLRAIRKAKEMEEDKKETEMEKEACKARTRLAKARIHFEVAKAIRGGKGGRSTASIAASIKAAAKEMPQSKNQTVWPNGTGAGGATAKGPEPQATAVTPTGTPDIAGQLLAIQKALDGQATLNASMASMMNAIARQPDPATGRPSVLPPVFDIAKAKPGDLNTMEAQIRDLAGSNVISFDEADRAVDTIGRARQGIPVDNIIASLAPQVQDIIRQRLAA
jgi:hypothetical protein